MPIILGLASLILLAVLFGPQVWVRRVLAQHGVDRPDLPGTGGELARHLLDEAGLRSVKVELTGDGDHYDPEEHAVRLLPQHHDGRSVAAVAVAAHEVSHAMQHLAGRARRELRQGAAGARARPLSFGVRHAGGPQRAAGRGLDLCRSRARHAARRHALAAHPQVLSAYACGIGTSWTFIAIDTDV